MYQRHRTVFQYPRGGDSRRGPLHRRPAASPLLRDRRDGRRQQRRLPRPGSRSGRVEYLRELGHSYADVHAGGMDMVVVEAHVAYLRAAAVRRRVHGRAAPAPSVRGATLHVRLRAAPRRRGCTAAARRATPASTGRVDAPVRVPEWLVRGQSAQAASQRDAAVGRAQERAAGAPRSRPGSCADRTRRPRRPRTEPPGVKVWPAFVESARPSASATRSAQMVVGRGGDGRGVRARREPGEARRRSRDERQSPARPQAT